MLTPVASSLLASTLVAACGLATVPPAPTLNGALIVAAADGDYAAALEQIDAANTAVNKDPEANIAQLEEAIEKLSEFGIELADDPEGREALELSRLNLARALLVVKQEDKASAIMDTTLIRAHGRDLPTKRFGPTLAKFAAKRLRTLEAFGTGTVEVNCATSCRVIIDEEVMGESSAPLFLGEHKVWIQSTDGSFETESYTVMLEEDGQVVRYDYPKDGIPEEPLPACEPVDVEPPPPPPPPPKRILPRWASITVAVIGAGAAVAGGVMLGLDGSCPGGLDPEADAADCPQIYEGTVPGLVAIGIGSALTVAGSVVIAVDEVRVGKQKGQQATIGWKMRF